MEEEAKALIIVLQTLARRGAATSRRQLGLVPGEYAADERPSGVLKKVVDQYARISDRDIADLLKSPLEQEFPQDSFIELEPSRYTNQGFSFLWCSWNLVNVTRGAFFFGMFRLAPRQFVEGDQQPKGHVPQFWGYRFETPQWQGTEHRFHHAQPTDCMSPARLTIRCSLPRPTNVPTFPLPCTTICGLLLTLVLCVLGRDKLDEIVGDLDLDRRAARNAYVVEGIRQAKAIVQP